MNGGHAIGAVRADDRQIGHADFARGFFFHETDAFNAAFVPRKTHANVIEQPAVDLVNDLQLPRKKDLEPCRRPFLQGFRQKCVVGVRQRFPGQVPGRVPFEVRVVQQYAHQFSHRHRRMCVVKLDSCLLGQLFPICVVSQKTSHQVSQRTSDKKIFLHEAQLLAGGSGVVWIQHPSQ